MDSRSRRIALLVLCAVMGIIKAQEIPVEDEYLRRLNVYETIQSVGDAPFGERLNLNTGNLIFSQTDVPLLGNGPAIALVRPSTRQRKEKNGCDPVHCGTGCYPLFGWKRWSAPIL